MSLIHPAAQSATVAVMIPILRVKAEAVITSLNGWELLLAVQSNPARQSA
jgi:hypothetical protein